MVERVEAVVVGDHDVGVLVEEQGQHVVALLGDGVVQRSVALRILNERSKLINAGQATCLFQLKWPGLSE